MAEFIAAWLPLVIVFAVFIGGAFWISKRQMKSYGDHVADVKSINAELIELNREMAAELREIKQILKDRT